jgi:predicted membrane channel-forming protein YqfA (hemolysin III family)
VPGISRSRFFRGFLVFVFLGAALFGCLAVRVLVEAATGHGSFGGNILLMGLGLMLLVVSAVAFIVGIICWRSSQPCRKDAKNN